MLRRLCSKVLAVDQTLLPTPALLRCWHANYCTTDGGRDDEDKPSYKETGFCQVNLLGRVGYKPKEFNSSGSDRTFVRFHVGVNKFNVSGKTEMLWHQVLVNHEVTKRWLLLSVDVGDRVFVRGNLVYNVDSADKNNKRYTINSEKIYMISRSKKNLERAIDDEDIEAEMP